MQVGKRGRGLSARDSIHSTTLGSVRVANRLVRQEMSRTPSCTMQYYYITGQLARTLIVRAKPARCIGNPHSRRLWRQPLYENTRTPGIYRSTNDSVMKSEWSSLVRGSDQPKCHSDHTSVGDMWRGPGRTHWQGGEQGRDQPGRQAHKLEETLRVQSTKLNEKHAVFRRNDT